MLSSSDPTLCAAPSGLLCYTMERGGLTTRPVLALTTLSRPSCRRPSRFMAVYELHEGTPRLRAEEDYILAFAGDPPPSARAVALVSQVGRLALNTFYEVDRLPAEIVEILGRPTWLDFAHEHGNTDETVALFNDLYPHDPESEAASCVVALNEHPALLVLNRKAVVSLCEDELGVEQLGLTITDLRSRETVAGRSCYL